MAVYSITPIKSFSEDHNPSDHHTFQESRKGKIEKEKEDSISRSVKRIQLFNDILIDNTIKYGSWKVFFKGMYGILVSLAPIAIFTMIPAHNIIKNPEYSYEFILQVCFAFLPTFAAAWTESFYFCTGIKVLRTIQFFMTLWIFLIVTSLITFGTINLIWIYGLNYQIPVPFTGYLFYLNTVILTPIVIWHRLPNEWHKSLNFKKRLRYFIIGSLYMTWTTLAYTVINKILLKIPIEYQWIAAAFLPLVKEFHLWAIIKINARCVDGDYNGMVIFRTQSVNIGHLIFLANTVGNIVTFSSSCIIIATDFMINMIICCKIIYLKVREYLLLNKIL